MKILILGGSGMLGHKLWQVLSRTHECFVTFRKSFDAYRAFGIFDERRSVCHVDVLRHDVLERVFASVSPQVVVNAVGIVKQLKEATDPLRSLEINAALPHRLALLCRRAGARLIHVSTDCVFSGERGCYIESDVTDARDLYGRTKALGEVTCDGCLTLRTSMVGRELETSHGLVEWFLGQRGGTVKGFSRAIFSGLVTAELARIIDRLICEQRDFSGLYHLAALPISKYELLCRVRDRLSVPVTIIPDDSVSCDRSLNGTGFSKATGIEPASWHEMVEMLWSDAHCYDEWRNSRGA
jgi:dTDP-4-dehydrorhamnose reductase